MRFLENDSQAVAVEVVRRVQVGSSYRISSSYGYAGIEDGIVHVLAILPHQVGPESYKALADVPARITDIQSWIDSHTEVELQNLGEDEDSYGQIQESLTELPWILYHYKGRLGSESYQVLPLETFLDHISQL